MAAHWCKVASNLDSDPKIRKVGRLGREVFLFALRRNAEPGNAEPGQIKADELDPAYVAEQLMMTCDEAVTGVTSLLSHGLLVKNGDFFVIAGWKEFWGKGSGGSAERMRKLRENKKVENVTSRDVTSDVTDRHSDACDTDKTRLDKTSKSPSQGDLALTTILVLEIIRNNPRSKLARLSGPEKDKKLAKWADHVRLMRESDGHTEAEIKAVIRWCQNDSFWRANILSTEKLREKWDTLVSQMGRAGSAPRPAKQQEQPTLTFMIGGVEVQR